jgi:hypothetical protein
MTSREILPLALILAVAGATCQAQPGSTEKVRHNFKVEPGYAPPAVDEAGNLYGTTFRDVYELDTAGRRTALHRLPARWTDACLSAG